MMALFLTFLIFFYIAPKLAERKERRYWSQKEIDKRWELNEQKRKKEFIDWCNSIVEQNKKENTLS
ncbi:MAG: hypothetical protein LBT48_08945 [Prevotellaceae bacterium]|jgi:hypothetical protein|nr:hypothetical protein [Prevotellaceae bacterium]